MDQSAFRRLNAQPCGRVKLRHVHFHVYATSSRTLIARRDESPPRQGRSFRAVLPRSVSACLSTRLGPAWKMLLTDFCNRLSTRAPALIARFSSSMARGHRRPNPHESLGRSPRVRVSSAPDHLAVIQPRVGARLTTLTQLRIVRSRRLLSEEETAGQPHTVECHPAAAFSTTNRIGETTL